MNFIATVFKWLFGIGMAIGLLIGIVLLFASQDAIPASVDDLSTVKVTIAEQHPMADGTMTTLKTKEHPNGKLIIPAKNGYSPESPVITLSPEQQIDIDIRKQDIRMLDKPVDVTVWGARSSDGKTLLDAKKMIDEINGSIMKDLDKFAYAMIIIPGLYFVGLIFTLFKRKPGRR